MIVDKSLKMTKSSVPLSACSWEIMLTLWPELVTHLHWNSRQFRKEGGASRGFFLGETVANVVSCKSPTYKLQAVNLQRCEWHARVWSRQVRVKLQLSLHLLLDIPSALYLHLLTVLNASPWMPAGTVLLHLLRYCDKNVFFIFCVCLLCIVCVKHYKPITVQYYMADCVSWAPRLTLLYLLDLQTRSQNRICSYAGNIL